MGICRKGRFHKKVSLDWIEDEGEGYTFFEYGRIGFRKVVLKEEWSVVRS